MRYLVGIVVCLAVAGTFSPVAAQAYFADSSELRGVQAFRAAGWSAPGDRSVPISGVVAADYDGDGDVDFFVPNGHGFANQLYRNDGSGYFEEIATNVGLEDADHGARAALWLDYDGDHRLDLLVGGDCRSTTVDTACPYDVGMRLFRQSEDGTFTDATAGSGLDHPSLSEMRSVSHRSGFVAGDLNNDNRLDLLLSTWNGSCHLMMNNGDGTFSDVTAELGLNELLFYQMPLMADINADGWLDLYVAIDGFVGNKLLLNHGTDRNGLPILIDVAPRARVDFAFNDMGVAVTDYNDDGLIDLYVTNIYRERDGIPMYNVLAKNISRSFMPRFKEVARESGVDNGFWGWGTTWIDADNDGDVDLAAANGRELPQWANDPARFWMNPGEEPYVFTDAALGVGYDHTRVCSSLISFDVDADGDLDMLETSVLDAETREGKVTIYENLLDDDSHHLIVRPRMAGANHRAIGAIVRVTRNDGTRMSRVITAGTSTLGQEPAEAFFGLGDETGVARVDVEYPNGVVRSATDVEADQALTITCDDREIGNSLRLGFDKQEDPENISISWSPSCRGDEGSYRLYGGSLGSFNLGSAALRLTRRRLDTGTMPQGNLWVLVQADQR